MAVLGTKLDYLIAQVSEICTHCKEQDARIDKLEAAELLRQERRERWLNHLKWAGGITGAVIGAVIIAYVLAWLGL